jgi:hypothetical protein
MADPIDRPIFILGSGRSGTTLLLDILTKHPDLAWISNIGDLHPDRPWLSTLARVWDIPTLGPKIAGRIPALLHSDETIRVYYYCGIHNLHWVKQDALTEADITPKESKCFKELIEQNLKFRGKTRFINKNTNNCMRVRYLKGIFPDAKFVHILRDGRAVANSLYHVKWWKDLKLWWSGSTPREWEEAGNPPIKLCGLHWQRQVEEILKAKPTIHPQDYYEFWYEEMAADPLSQLRKILDFCELPWNTRFEKAINKIPISNYNFKWREQLTSEEQAVLQETIGGFLKEINCPVEV